MTPRHADGRRARGPRTHGNERGFAIPVTILLITIISVMLSSGFARVRADRQVAEGAEVSAEALSIARSGLAEFMAYQTLRPPNNYVDTMYVTGGYAIINATILRNPADTLAVQSWVLRSTGYVIDAGTGSTPRAQRTVAQMAQWQTGYVRPRAGITAANDLQVHRYGGVYISGTDFGGCWTNTPPGIRARRLDVDGGNSQYYLYAGAVTGRSGRDVALEMGIDWAAIRSGALKADHTTMGNWWDWSVTYIDGDLDITPSSGITGGSGVLIVRDNLRIRTTFMFLGLVIVGGEIAFEPPAPSGYVYLRGLTVSGMNEVLGQNPSDTDIGWDDSSYYNTWTYLLYDSCMLTQALENFHGFIPVENAWVDNWATF